MSARATAGVSTVGVAAKVVSRLNETFVRRGGVTKPDRVETLLGAEFRSDWVSSGGGRNGTVRQGTRRGEA